MRSTPQQGIRYKVRASIPLGGASNVGPKRDYYILILILMGAPGVIKIPLRWATLGPGVEQKLFQKCYKKVCRLFILFLVGKFNLS